MTFPFFETLVFSIFDVLQYYLITNKLNNGRISVLPKHILGISVCALCIALSSVIVEGVNAYFVNTLIFMSLSYFVYNRKGLHLIYFHIIGISLVMTLQLIIIFLLNVLIGDIGYTAGIGMVAQVLGLGLAILAAKFLPIHLLFRYVEVKNDLFRVVVLNLFILLTFCVIYWYMHFEGIVENLIWISAIIVIILLINLILLKEGLKNQVIEEQNRAYELYLPIVNELMDEIRIKQHNFDNHIAALKIVLEQHRGGEAAMEKVEGYIQEMDDSFRNADLLKMKNKILAGFLYSKTKQAKEEGISFDVFIEDSRFETGVKDYELLDILSVMIDNAFETGVSDNAVRVHFYKEKNKSVIEIANKHPYISTTQINEFFANGFSSKGQKNRGLGLYKLKLLVSKNKGELEVLNVDFGENYIMFRVALP